MRSLALTALVAFAGSALAQSPAPPDALPPPAHSISGVVTDAETGLPLVGAGVVIPELGIGSISDRQGRFVIEDVPTGTHTVRAGAYRYHLQTFSVEKEEGQGATLAAPLAPGAGVGCEVLHSHDDAGGLHNVGGTD